MPVNLKIALPLVIWLLFFALDAQAQALVQPLDSVGLFDDVSNRYAVAAKGWSKVITDAASWLFWTLVGISMAWTFGMMALRKADIGEFLAEFFRFITFTGFFWWLLTNGPDFSSTIYASLAKIAGNATGLGDGMSPSGIVDVGFKIYRQMLKKSSVWSPLDSMLGSLLAVAILVILALISVNMLLLMVSSWMLAYGGVFFLGFGGSRWTSDMAINYYKTVLGVAAQLMAMVLLVGIGKTFLDDYYMRMGDNMPFNEMGVMLVVCVILLSLVNKIPALIAGIITGASVGGAGIGNLGAGTAVAAAGMAVSAAGMAVSAMATGGAALAAGAAAAGGGAKALMAAFSKASENVSSGSDVISGLMGGGGGDAGDGGDGDGSGDAGGGDTSTPLSHAAGFGGSKGGDVGPKGGQAPTGGSKEGGQSGSKPSLLSSAASALGKAGRITADAGVNLAKGVGAVANTKIKSMNNTAKARISDTVGGKIAAAIKGTGEKAKNATDSAGTDTTSEFSGNSLGGDTGGGEGWINQTGGFNELSEADQKKAEKSHTEWKARSEGNTFGLDDYVSYVQERQQERRSEVENFVNKGMES